MGSRKQKRQTLKQQLFFPFSQAQLDLLPDSSPPPLLSLQVTLSPSPFREEASGAKGVQRGCDQGVGVSLFHSFLLIPFSPCMLLTGCREYLLCYGAHSPPALGFSLLFLTFFHSPSLFAGHFFFPFLNMFSQKCYHLSMDTWPLFKRATPAASILTNLATNIQYQRCSISALLG